MWIDTYIYTVESWQPDLYLYIYCDKSIMSGLDSSRSTYTLIQIQRQINITYIT